MLKRLLFSKKWLIITSIFFVLFIALVLPYFSALTESKTNSTFSPDTGFFYTLEEFYNNMEIYGIEGRNFYILMRWTFDVVWPIVYFSFFTAVLGNLIKKTVSNKKTLFLALPIIGVIFDFIENILATISVYIYPKRVDLLLRLLQVTSLLKWALILITTFAIVYLLILNLIRKKTDKQNLAM